MPLCKNLYCVSMESFFLFLVLFYVVGGFVCFIFLQMHLQIIAGNVEEKVRRVYHLPSVLQYLIVSFIFYKNCLKMNIKKEVVALDMYFFFYLCFVLKMLFVLGKYLSYKQFSFQSTADL